MSKGHSFIGKLAFKATRLSNNIPYALPFVFMGANDLKGNYQGFLKVGLKNIIGVNNRNGIIAVPNIPYVPANELTLFGIYQNVFPYPDGSVVFVYQQLTTGFMDYVLVEFISEMSYQTFLQSLQTKKMAFKKIVMNISDITVLGQLDQPILVGSIDPLSSQSQTSFTPSTFQDPTNAVANAIKMEFPLQHMTKQYGVVSFLQQNLNPYYIVYTLDSEEEEK